MPTTEEQWTDTLKFARCVLKQRQGRDPDQETVEKVARQLLDAKPPTGVTLEDVQAEDEREASFG